MSEYVINVTDRSGNVGSVSSDNFFYTDLLNKVNRAEIRVDSLSTVERSLFQNSGVVEVKRNGVRVFYGKIEKIGQAESGGVAACSMGYEGLMSEDASYANSPWTSTASLTIATEIIAESSFFTAGTIEAGASIDFRASVLNSQFNELANLVLKTGQDVGVDYVNLEIDVLNHKGSSTSVAILNDGREITNLQVDRLRPLGNDVRVIGKGDGAIQIQSEAAHGQDATSKTTHGVITHRYPDRSVMTVGEANVLADAVVALTKDEREVYDFDVLDPNQDWVSGDVVVLNSEQEDINSVQTRFVGLTRGVTNGEEFLRVQVTNESWKTLVTTKNDFLNQLRKQQKDENFYMQGSGNTLVFQNAVNAKNGTPLVVEFQIPSGWVSDEAGNMRVSTMTVDYDVDPYKKGVGSAGETNKSPSLTGGNTASHKHDAADSGHPHTLQSMTSSNSEDPLVSLGNDFVTGLTLNAAAWNLNACSVTVSENIDVLYCKVQVEYSAGANTPSLVMRIQIDGTDYIQIPIYGVFHGDASRDKWLATIPVYLDTTLTSKDIDFDFYPSAAIDVDVAVTLYSAEYIHAHTITGYSSNSANAAVSDSNKTPSLTGSAASHNHSVSIGDDVSDAGSINATQVSIYLDFWNTGTSTWDNKHSVLNTGKTLDTDVDITNSGTYPDAAGFWRIRIDPDDAGADYVQSIVKIKHSLDN